MIKARRIAKRFGAERVLISAASKMVEAVEVVLRQSPSRRLKAELRELAYGLAGLGREAGYVEGLTAQIKDIRDSQGREGGRGDPPQQAAHPEGMRASRRRAGGPQDGEEGGGGAIEVLAAVC